MAIAVFGGTGFLGYNFLRLCQRESALACQVYSGSPDQLVNLSRHNIPVQAVDWSRLDRLDLPQHIETIVNFSHPFGKRSGLNAEEQIEQFGAFIKRNAGRRKLRLVQLSSMVVYEPFSTGFEYPEDSPLDAAGGDEYARQKVYLEKAVRSWGVPVANLRPTIVYGPFGVDFTDLFLNGFAAGNLRFHNLDGRIQPVFVEDISRFILDLVDKFSEADFNLGGPERLSWREYLDFHQKIVDFGSLVHAPETRQGPVAAKPSRLALAARVLKNLLRDPAFRDLVAPLVARLPQRFRNLAKKSVDENPAGLVGEQASYAVNNSPFNTNSALARRLENKLASDFFGQDKLVSLKFLRGHHPQACQTTLASQRDLLSRYFRFRFCDSP